MATEPILSFETDVLHIVSAVISPDILEHFIVTDKLYVNRSVPVAASYRESGELLSASCAHQAEESQQRPDAHPDAAQQEKLSTITHDPASTPLSLLIPYRDAGSVQPVGRQAARPFRFLSSLQR
ncbi:hypothetical protein CCH79_00001307 [Gambusia affinis]|uniref:Uncharacterized protein n=1 Tax=Gambusia affinis TaxID=33528 RepID=A0A315VRG4_GAMAF|nr:hypothetical protein CCH79_00001307 [Gambusia affinis]